MNKLPTALSLPVFGGAVKRAISYSKHFKDIRQRQNFIYLISSILFNNSCLLNKVQSITLIAKSWTACLSNFLKSNAWNTDILDNILQSLFRKHGLAIKYIVLDWTALVKTGKCFNFVGNVYDGRDGKIKNGFPLLLALAVSEGKNLILPLVNKLTAWNHPAFTSENIIINNLIDSLKQQLLASNKGLSAKTIFLLDAGFYRTIVIKHLLKSQLLFIINGIEDRNIILTDKNTRAKTETKLGNLAEGYYEKVYIKHLRRQLTVGVYFEENKKGVLEKRILISNLKNQNLAKMKQAYKHRWAIEEYFKELKGKYNLENFRVREFKAMERIVKLILIAHALFADSLSNNGYWIESVKLILRRFLNLKTVIKKKGISLLREIAQRLANFGLMNKFRLVLKEKQMFYDYVF